MANVGRADTEEVANAVAAAVQEKLGISATPLRLEYISSGIAHTNHFVDFGVSLAYVMWL